MPQNPSNITESSEFKEFCKNNNLEIYNQEAINVFLYAFCEKVKLTDCVFESNIMALGLKVGKLEEENKKLREMLNEIAKNIQVSYEEGKFIGLKSLFDKWNNNL